jgi:hypothetical protein
MIPRPAMALILCAWVSAMASAEPNCGSMMRTVVRFHATVRSVEPLGGRELEVTPIDPEMLFAVSVDVDRVERASPALKAGEQRNFGVHSPSRTFGSEEIVGTGLDLEAEWMACDGAFRRLVGLRRNPGPVVEDFDEWLEVGHTYRAEVEWEPDFGLSLVKRLRVPMHHDRGVVWKNLDAFPELMTTGAAKPIVFEVVAVRIDQIGERRWLSMYDLTIVESEESLSSVDDRAVPW